VQSILSHKYLIFGQHLEKSYLVFKRTKKNYQTRLPIGMQMNLAFQLPQSVSQQPHTAHKTFAFYCLLGQPSLSFSFN
jgi:hypothetical protein